MNLPDTVHKYLDTAFIQSRFPAFVFIDKSGVLAKYGGYCERYGLNSLQIGATADDQLDFVAGMLPLDGHWFCLSRLLIDDMRVVDAHFIPDDNGCWVVLLDVSEDAEKDMKIQQQSNELHLLKKEQQDILHRLQTGADNLLAVLNQLNLTIFMINSTGTVTFVSRSGLKIMGLSITSVKGHHWRDVLPLSSDDADTFQKMLALPQNQRKRIQGSLHISRRGSSQPPANTIKSFEIDIRDDPRSPNSHIAYFYDISELIDLRNLLHNKSRFENMIGKSHAMQQIFEQIKNVARFDTTVLVEGETGTGKELAARAIHNSSSRKDGPLIIVNCAGLADSLINSQLFGHKKGSFTDAVSDRKGVFEAADGGTIVLDEIGDIPMNTQTRILRALEQREIIRVGETEPRKVNIRIIAATNKKLDDEVEKGNFRLDLLYRIKVARVTLPPLRERREDIPILVDFFINEICVENGIEQPRVERDALSTMMLYRWPGNIRELRNAVEFALIRCRDGVIRTTDLPPEITLVEKKNASRMVDDSEKERISEALKACGNNRERAAKLLGISRATLYRKIKAYCLNDNIL